MQKKLGIILMILWVISTTHCAKRGTPTGGPKDSIPPVLMSANPALNKVNFDAEKIVLIFDEYIQLKDVANQLIVSPPLEKSSYRVLPEGTVSKKVEIRFEEAPRDNTTYTFNFGEAIEDYNENNKLPFFSYTFSTGDYLDSLTLSGTVKDAYALDSLDRVSIHLYPIDSTFTDSTIYLQKPLYVGNTLDSIYFKLQSLAPGKYEFLAIKDVGKNYLFDQSIDMIGFFEQPIELPQDSLKFPVLFKEVTNFRWGRPRYVNDHHLEFPFFGEVNEKRVKFTAEFEEKGQGFFTRDREKDSLHYWFLPQKNLDSIVVALEEMDSLRPVVIKPFKAVLDSLELEVSPRNQSILHFLDTLKIKSTLPITEVNNDFIQIFDIDTLEVPFNSFIDPNKDRVYLDFKKVQNDIYRIQLLPNAIKDFLGATNDTITHTVRTQAVENYGTLYLTVEQKDNSIPYFFELIDKKGSVIRKVVQNEENSYVLNYLIPKEYQIRFVKDRNGNGKWDTGNYLKKQQPEEVLYLADYLTLRENWDLIETFTIE
ncbi:MAG: Ig-like domain-containing protein [Flavobacteriaceae bacterium]